MENGGVDGLGGSVYIGHNSWEFENWVFSGIMEIWGLGLVLVGLGIAEISTKICGVDNGKFWFGEERRQI